MAKVGLKEFKKIEKEMSVPKIVEFEGVKFEVKQYLSANDKQVIIDLVVENSIIELSKTYDKHIRNIMEEYLIARYYTNINLSNDPIEMYDLLESTKLYSVIIAYIPTTEIKYLVDMIDHKIEEEKGRLTREGTFVEVIERLINSIDIDKMTNALKDFDPKVLDNVIPKPDLELIKKK